MAWFRNTCFRRAVQAMRFYMSSVSQDGLDKFYRRHKGKTTIAEIKKRIPEQQARASIVFQAMLTRIHGETLIDLDCWFNLWLDGRFAYVIPCYPQRRDKITPPKWCEDFCYFDNVDLPKGVSQREWQKRKAKWEQLCLEDHNRSRLSHIVIEAINCGLGVGFSELEKRLLADGQGLVLSMALFDARESPTKKEL
jgi:hypothetical protein